MAVRIAKEAVELDERGSPQAIEKYQRAIELLQTLCRHWPWKPYYELMMAYQRRIHELKLQGLLPKKTLDKRLDSLLFLEKPNVRWDDIAGLENAKRALQEAIVYPHKRPELFPLGWPANILLFGPPGCGKTLLASAAATELDATFLCVSAPVILSRYLGDSEKNVAGLFAKARTLAAERKKPVILYLDELDALLGTRAEELGGEARVKSVFLEEMDHIADKGKKLHLHVIGATNVPWRIEKAFIRRFQLRIYVPLPDYRTRLQMFKLFSRDLELASDVSFEELAEATDGYSGSDIKDLFRAVQMKIVRELFKLGVKEPRAITMGDFLEAIRTRKPSVSEDLLWMMKKWREEFEAL
jgi:SpoVK/Ycf46/Vps4 family AAA+-type ATPase